MISIIICSRSEQIGEYLTANIKETIGVPYEIIFINNAENQYSIFQAYNIGVTRSRGSILCFMHDDIFFHTNNWGVKVSDYFKQEETGAIGIAGTPYAAKMPGSWWGCGLINQQLVRKQDDQLIKTTKYIKNQNNGVQEVILLDGVWLCINAELFKEISFDERNFTGFHFYDVDICLQISNCGYKLYCIYDILIEHFSEGDINQTWIANSIKLNKKWHSNLPLSALKLTKNEKKAAEISTINEFLEILFSGRKLNGRTYFFTFKKIALNVSFLFSIKSIKITLKFINRSFLYLINHNKKHERNLQ